MELQREVDRIWKKVLVLNAVHESGRRRLTMREDSKVFYLTMREDCYRYLADIKTGSERIEAAENTLSAYKMTQTRGF
ncbi:hypothetical protein L2E82_18489 [Cichorium intybus]|uniref:Uncharacterized protein n=1 Tax=Cichorium intybus TaxID=13427 RepID=A0ACB9FBP6_CICIN|nr:hypothetical protein L2E82_18489 [Cichorium intybus]